METLVLVGVVVAIALLMNRFVFGGMNLAGAMGELFTGLRSSGWPVGVQEEDRDRPWGSRPESQPDPPSDATPADCQAHPQLVRVKPVIRAR